MHVGLAASHHNCSQRNAGVHRAAEVDVPNGAGVGAAADGFQFVDDLHRTDFRCPRDGAGRQARPQRIEGRCVWGEAAGDMACEVHHVAVAFDRHHITEHNRADCRHSTHVVAAKIDEHYVLGAFLGIGQEPLGKQLILLRCRSPRACAGQRSHRNGSVNDAHHNFG